MLVFGVWLYLLLLEEEMLSVPFEDGGHEFKWEEQKDTVGCKALCTACTLKYSSPSKLSV